MISSIVRSASQKLAVMRSSRAIGSDTKATTTSSPMTASLATADSPIQAYISYANGAGIYQPISSCITSVLLGFLIRIGPYRVMVGLAEAIWTHGGGFSDVAGAVSGLSALRVQESRTPSVCTSLSFQLLPVPKSQPSAVPPLTTPPSRLSKHLKMHFGSLLLPLLTLVAFTAAAPIRGPLGEFLCKARHLNLYLHLDTAENHRRSAERFDYPDSKDVKERSVAANRVFTYIDAKNIA